MLSFLEEQYELEYEKFVYDIVLVKRNRQMMETIINLMETNDKVKFFAVGVCHPSLQPVPGWRYVHYPM